MSNSNVLIRGMVSVVASFIATAGIISFYEPFYKFTMIIGFIMFCLFAVTIYFVSNKYDRFEILKESHNLWSLLFILLFPILIMISTAPDQSHIETTIMQIVTYLITYVVYVGLLLGLIEIIFRLNVKGSSLKFSFLIYFMIPVIGWALYLIAFYPGTMTPDSLAQWGQAHSYEWNNWHPIVHTWLLTALLQLWDSPAIISSFQILIMALIWAYSMKSIEKKGVSFLALALFSIVAAAWPVLGIFSITLWKDILYSFVLFLFCVLIFNMVFTRGLWLDKKRNLILLLITSLAVVFFRHNGFPVFLVTGVFLFIVFRKHWKPLLLNFVAIIGIYLIVTGPVFSAFNVEPTELKEALGIPTQQIANIVENGEMTQEQKEYINEVMPLEIWKKYYHPYKVDPLKFSGEYDDVYISETFGQFLKVWSGMVIQNPGLAIEAFLRETSVVWQMHEPEEPGYTSKYVTNIYLNNEFGLENKVIDEKLTKDMREYLEDSQENFLTTIWRPASYLLTILFLTFAAVMKHGKSGSIWLIALPVLLNVGSVAASLPAQEFRYLFSNVPLALFLIAVMWIGRDDKRVLYE
ncbi:DUF6020 family protein [Pontibacillus marinus]|uniref:Membrane protein n=1 Tax=Pontibacillus marinus BH030004 = DSM 16465 TaxID=1385511 RepID=A0A0A5GHI3_9BACI|nr:DUF6020 family protein [Pontibacillus marinus]KGX91469.1 membrane protein [Pontibacillus marinus BH030004 = DSM 16465]